MGAIDLDEIERRIPSPATECAYCYRLGTMRCLACGALACDDHRTFAVRDAIDTGCEGVAMVPAQHDAATMDRVALVAEVRRLRALAIYAALATVAGVFCALGWRWQTRLSDRALDIAEEAQEHAAAALDRERRMLLALETGPSAEALDAPSGAPCLRCGGGAYAVACPLCSPAGDR